MESTGFGLSGDNLADVCQSGRKCEQYVLKVKGGGGKTEKGREPGGEEQHHTVLGL